MLQDRKGILFMKLDRAEVLALLRSSEDYVSGQELCERFQVSRTAVWKVINQLKESGYEIEAVQNRGYRLVSAPAKMSESEIRSRMETKWIAKEIYYYDSIDSTNVEAKRLAESGASDGALVTADAQTAGRGRRGRKWESPSGSNIYFTLLLKPAYAPDKASMLTLVIAHSVAAAIEKVCGLKVGIKWPNDLVSDGKKLCGILTEMTMEMDYIVHVVVGVGINVNQDDESQFPEEIRQTATSLKMQCGRSFDRAELIAACMKAFETDYEKFLQTQDLSLLLDSYNQLLINRERKVKVLDPKGAYEGIAKGILANGDLIVERENGEKELVYAGEVSVRGVYGYV